MSRHEKLTGVFRTGAGEPLVLLHGAGGTWHGWAPVLQMLAQKHEVIAITMPGHSGGVALEGEPSIAVLTDTLMRQLQAMGLASAHVVGNSLGGLVAVELARRGFARSVVALSPAGAWAAPSDAKKFTSGTRLMLRLMPLIYVMLWPWLACAAVRKIFFAGNMVHGDRVSAALMRQMLRGVMDCRMLSKLIAETVAGGQVERLPDRGIRVRIVWGDCDQATPFARYGKPFVDRIGQHELVRMPGVGHVPIFDDPDAVTKAILEVTANGRS